MSLVSVEVMMGGENVTCERLFWEEEMTYNNGVK